jgi:hypothetical protein
MRKSLMVGIPAAVVGIAVAVGFGIHSTAKNPADGFASDLQRADAAGLELAQSQASQKFSLSETVPEAKPEPAKSIKKASTGPKAVHSRTPTVKAAAEPTVADVVEEMPQVQVMQTAKAPTPVEAPTPAPQPVPVTTQPAPGPDQGPILAGGSGRGTSGNGGGTGIGTVIGVIFGSVLRGGGVDGDNCDPRPTSRRPVYGGGQVYQPANPGGMGGGRVVLPRSGTVHSAPQTPVRLPTRQRGGR